MELLTRLGIEMNQNKSIFYNELTGVVMFRGTESDANVFHAAMETLGGTEVSRGFSGLTAR